MNIAIKSHNQEYVAQLQKQAGLSTPAETLNFLLTSLRIQGFYLAEEKDKAQSDRDIMAARIRKYKPDNPDVN
jgi:hypothetical protein